MLINHVEMFDDEVSIRPIQKIIKRSQHILSTVHIINSISQMKNVFVGVL